MIAQELALAHPERVDKLVLVATIPGGPRSRPMPLPTTYLFAWAPLMTSQAKLRQLLHTTLGGGQLVEVEGGQLAGDPDRGGGLVAGDRTGLGGDEPVQALAQLVGQQRDGPPSPGCLGCSPCRQGSRNKVGRNRHAPSLTDITSSCG